MTLTHNEQGPLAKLGILDTIKARDEEKPSRRHWIFSSDGVILGYYGDYAPPSVERTQRGNLRIPRQELRTILLQRLRPGTVQWGKRLVGFNVICGQRRQTKRRRLHQNAKSDKNVQGTTVGDDKDMVGVNKKTCVEEEKKVAAEEPKEEDDTVVLQFADGSTVSDVAVLIGADGIRSRTRDLMDAAPQPQPEKAHRRSERRHEASDLKAEAFGALHVHKPRRPATLTLTSWFHHQIRSYPLVQEHQLSPVAATTHRTIQACSSSSAFRRCAILSCTRAASTRSMARTDSSRCLSKAPMASRCGSCPSDFRTSRTRSRSSVVASAVRTKEEKKRRRRWESPLREPLSRAARAASRRRRIRSRLRRRRLKVSA